MLKSCCTKIMLFLVAFFILGTHNVYAKKMYRWVDDDGRVFFSDQVPQDQIQHKRESLNENARVIEIVEEAKTEEQLELEKRLKNLRLEQEKIIAKQKSHDKVLLSTFRNLDDMRMALNGKMSAMDAQRKVAEGNLIRLELQLDQQQKQAAEYERRGQKVPERLLAEIEASIQQIDEAKLEIHRHLQKKHLARKEFEADIERFAFLTQSQTDAAKLSNETAEYRAASELGLFICDNQEQCEQAWQVARRFVNKYSTTAVDIDSDKLIMRAQPMHEDDLSLSVSKMTLDQGRQQIFLDIRCRKSTLGVELCASPMIKSLRYSFTGFIEAGLAPQQ